MPTTCPQCSQVNPDQSTFCVKCGNRLQSNNQPTSSTSLPTFAASGSLGSAPPYPSQSSTLQPPSSPSFQPPPSAQLPFPSPSAPTPSAPQAWPGYAAPSQLPAQMGTGQGLASIRRAFAGRGTLIMHHSWLLDGRQVQVVSLLTAIREMLAQRSYAGLNVTPERLTERSISMEARDYLTVNRANSTVFIYVAPAGSDLYISRATTVLPSISNLRVAILGLMLFAIFFGPPILQNAATNVASSSGGNSSATLLLLIPLLLIGFIFALAYIPLVIFLIAVLIRSFINWLIEKDFWVYLRPNVLHDFQMDDIALLEHATDKVVRGAVEQLGLDASQINPPPQGYQPKRRIRII